MSKGLKIALISLVSLGALTGIIVIVMASSRKSKRKASCIEKGLEGAELDACMDELKQQEKNNRSQVQDLTEVGMQGDNNSSQNDYVSPSPPAYTGGSSNVGMDMNSLFNPTSSSGSSSSGSAVGFPLKYGSRGAKVKAIQKAHNVSYPSDRITVDGIWGNDTQSRAKQLLKRAGLSTSSIQVSKAVYDKYFKRYE